MLNNGAHYVSAGVREVLGTGIQNLLWLILDHVEIEVESPVQVFTLSIHEKNRQKIVHTQIPLYRKEFSLLSTAPLSATVYVICDGQDKTMMLGNEYQEGK